MTRRIRQREAGHCRDGRIRVTPHRVTQSTGGVKRRPSDLTPARCNPTPQTFHSKGFPGGVPETPKDPPRNTSGCLSSVPPGTHGWQRCLFFDPGSDAGVVVSSGPRRAFIHRVRRIARSKKERVRPNEPAPHLRSSFKSRMSECQSDDAGASPADRTIFKKPSTHGGRQRAAESPKLSHSGQHRIAVPINMWPISQRLEAGACKASISRCKSCIGLPTINHGELAHSVEHRSCKPEAAGAKPAFSTIYQTGRLGSSEPRCL